MTQTSLPLEAQLGHRTPGIYTGSTSEQLRQTKVPSNGIQFDGRTLLKAEELEHTGGPHGEDSMIQRVEELGNGRDDEGLKFSGRLSLGQGKTPW
ncbi:uncharacterized protein N7459_000641 [Penicillium hispanicum]|uniref:uncharacterized protein n=1 Tax=Penicillium hispanicum TaxID=1080232 RepID=UPI002540E64C|nr:uncharacterized protein N7459_000641 [Penicillium hispanicum]KAJ5594433.1 hypothetical protein N7459_000641 [Penicillium hispanicum]